MAGIADLFDVPDLRRRMAEAGEDVWYATYVDLRRQWLADSTNPLVRKTTYRMEAMGNLIAAGKWGLELPLTVHGVVIDADVLAGKPGG